MILPVGHSKNRLRFLQSVQSFVAGVFEHEDFAEFQIVKAENRMVRTVVFSETQYFDRIHWA